MLAAGIGWKLLDFLVFFFFNGVLPGNETVFFFSFWHFSVRYNVSFTKIIRLTIPNGLNVFFSHFFMKLYFLAFKNNIKKYLRSR